MLFAEPKQPSFRPPAKQSFWRMLLFVAAAAGAIAAMRPWIKVKFVSLFGEAFGSPAWQCTTGFTCMCTCAMLAVMALIETQNHTARQAVRPASLMLAIIMGLALALRIAQGPGTLRGVSAMWTMHFYIGSTSVLLVLTACAVRFASDPARQRTPHRDRSTGNR